MPWWNKIVNPEAGKKPVTKSLLLSDVARSTHVSGIKALMDVIRQFMLSSDIAIEDAFLNVVNWEKVSVMARSHKTAQIA